MGLTFYEGPQDADIRKTVRLRLYTDDGENQHVDGAVHWGVLAFLGEEGDCPGSGAVFGHSQKASGVIGESVPVNELMGAAMGIKITMLLKYLLEELSRATHKVGFLQQGRGVPEQLMSRMGYSGEGGIGKKEDGGEESLPIVRRPKGKGLGYVARTAVVEISEEVFLAERIRRALKKTHTRRTVVVQYTVTGRSMGGYVNLGERVAGAETEVEETRGMEGHEMVMDGMGGPGTGKGMSKSHQTRQKKTKSGGGVESGGYDTEIVA